jgi:hypothetical protein
MVDIEEAREFVRLKEQRRKDELHKLFERAWDDFNKIVEMLIKKYNPRRIYQWGSLLTFWELIYAILFTYRACYRII